MYFTSFPCAIIPRFCAGSIRKLAHFEAQEFLEIKGGDHQLVQSENRTAVNQQITEKPIDMKRLIISLLLLSLACSRYDVTDGSARVEVQMDKRRLGMDQKWFDTLSVAWLCPALMMEAGGKFNATNGQPVFVVPGFSSRFGLSSARAVEVPVLVDPPVYYVGAPGISAN